MSQPVKAGHSGSGLTSSVQVNEEKRDREGGEVSEWKGRRQAGDGRKQNLEVEGSCMQKSEGWGGTIDRKESQREKRQWRRTTKNRGRRPGRAVSVKEVRSRKGGKNECNRWKDVKIRKYEAAKMGNEEWEREEGERMKEDGNGRDRVWMLLLNRRVFVSPQGYWFSDTQIWNK